MEYYLGRYHFSAEDTLGLLWRPGLFLAYTLEDQERDGPKVKFETAIPRGRYPLIFRHSPKFSEVYGHEMIEIDEVPGFDYTYLHPGITDDDTGGCPLVGGEVRHNPKGRSSLSHSKITYLDVVYPDISKHMQRERCFINVYAIAGPLPVVPIRTVG